MLITRVQELQTGSIQVARAQIDRDLDDTQQRITNTSNRLNQIAATINGESNPVATAEVDRLQSQLVQDQDRYRKLLEMRQSNILVQGQGASAVSVIDPALTPTAPVPSHTIQNIALDTLLGLLLAAGITLLLSYFDDRMLNPEQIREQFNVTALVTVPLIRGGVPRVMTKATSRDSEAIEELRLLRTSMESVKKGRSQAICITSAPPGEGKSTVAANLAVIEAQSGKRVILVDTNLRDPHVHQIFGLSNDEGLSTLLTEEDKSLETVLQEGHSGLAILLSGPVLPNPTELLDSSRMAALMTSLRCCADLVILDAAPILPVTDTLVLQRYIDGNIVVTDIRRTRTKPFGQALAAIEHASGRVLGVVVNKVDRHMGSYGYNGLFIKALFIKIFINEAARSHRKSQDVFRGLRRRLGLPGERRSERRDPSVRRGVPPL
ncbi:MAG: polysaccharide biosynthesis tyrosine autokinase [Dehalococcoidia bacterium]